MRVELARTIIRALWNSNDDGAEKVVEEIMDDVTRDAASKVDNVELLELRKRIAELEDRLSVLEEAETHSEPDELPFPECDNAHGGGIIKMCKKCGHTFSAKNDRCSICPDCKKERQKQNYRRWAEKHGTVQKAVADAVKQAEEHGAVQKAAADAVKQAEDKLAKIQKKTAAVKKKSGKAATINEDFDDAANDLIKQTAKELAEES